MYHPTLGHAQLKVRDLERAIRFYTRLLHLQVVERIGDQFAFLSSDGHHHELALQNIGPLALQPHMLSTGLAHVAFRVADKAALAAAFEALQGAGIELALSDNQITWALYFQDPDGNGLELYCDTSADAGATCWAGQSRPLTARCLRGFLAPCGNDE